MSFSHVFRSVSVLMLMAVWLVSDRRLDAQWYFWAPYGYQGLPAGQPLLANGKAYTATGPIPNTNFYLEVGHVKFSGGPRGVSTYTYEGDSAGISDGLGLWTTTVSPVSGGSWQVGGGNTIPPAPGTITNVVWITDGYWMNNVIVYFQ